MIESINSLAIPAISWLLTYAIHCTLLLGSALLLQYFIPDRARILRDLVIKGALIGSLLTASLATILPERSGVFTVFVYTHVASASADQVDFGRKALLSDSGENNQYDLSSEAKDEQLTSQTGSSKTDAGLVTRLLASIAGISPLGFLFLSWIVISFYLVVKRACAYLHFRAALRRVGCDRADSARKLLNRLTSRSTVRFEPRLTRSDRLLSPVAIASIEMCLPHDFESRFSPAEQRAVLAHELAHIQRLDPIWRLASEFASSLFFFQPLLLVAAKRLRVESEFLADEFALRRTGDAPALARSLLTAASALHINQTFSFTPAMAGKDASLSKRTMNMLSFDPASSKSRSGFFALTTMMLSVLLVGWFSPIAGPSIEIDEISTDSFLSDNSQSLVADTTVAATITWIDGELYRANIDFDTSGQGDTSIESHLEIDISFEDADASIGKWKLIFHPGVKPSNKSAKWQIDDDERLTSVFEQAIEIAQRHHIQGVNYVAENLDEYSLLLLASKPRSGSDGESSDSSARVSELSETVVREIEVAEKVERALPPKLVSKEGGVLTLVEPIELSGESPAKPTAIKVKPVIKEIDTLTLVEVKPVIKEIKTVTLVEVKPVIIETDSTIRVIKKKEN